MLSSLSTIRLDGENSWPMTCLVLSFSCLHSLMSSYFFKEMHISHGVAVFYVHRLRSQPLVWTCLLWMWAAVFLCVPQYKSNHCKKVCVTGWMVVLPDDPARPNIFQLNDPDKGQLHTPFSVFSFPHLNSDNHTKQCVALHRQCLQVPDRIQVFSDHLAQKPRRGL